MNPRVSVIVAAYNAELTLPRCVASIQAQTLRDIEILIVDDVSSDGTFRLAESLALSDDRIRSLRRDVNGGPGGARNTGLDAARGEWIAVVDADDEIDPDRLAVMVAAAEAQAADIIFDNLLYLPLRGAPSLYLPNDTGLYGLLPFQRYIASHQYQAADPVLGFLKPLVRRSLLETHHIRYEPGLRIGEDTLLILNLYAQGARVIILPDAHYRYHRMPGSISYVFDVKAAAMYLTVLRQFVETNAARFSAAEQEELRAFLIYASQRQQAKTLVDAMTPFNFPVVIGQAARDKAVFKLFRHYLVVEARTKAGKLRRALRH